MEKIDQINIEDTVITINADQEIIGKEPQKPIIKMRKVDILRDSLDGCIESS